MTRTPGELGRRAGVISLLALLTAAIAVWTLALQHVNASQSTDRDRSGPSSVGSPVGGPTADATSTARPDRSPESPSPSGVNTPVGSPSEPPSVGIPGSVRRVPVVLVGDFGAVNPWEGVGSAPSAGWPSMVEASTSARAERVTWSGYQQLLFQIPTPAPSSPGRSRSGGAVAVVVVPTPADGNLPRATVTANATALWSQLRSAYPTSTIVALGLAETRTRDRAAEVNDALRGAAAAAHVHFVDTSTVVGAGRSRDAALAAAILRVIPASSPPK